MLRLAHKLLLSLGPDYEDMLDDVGEMLDAIKVDAKTRSPFDPVARSDR